MSEKSITTQVRKSGRRTSKVPSAKTLKHSRFGGVAGDGRKKGTFVCRVGGRWLGGCVLPQGGGRGRNSGIIGQEGVLKPGNLLLRAHIYCCSGKHRDNNINFSKVLGEKHLHHHQRRGCRAPGSGQGITAHLFPLAPTEIWTPRFSRDWPDGKLVLGAIGSKTRLPHLSRMRSMGRA